jgi:ribose 1,5-bisphosphokinase
VADIGCCNDNGPGVPRLGPGRVVLIVGPSGAGKDAIIGLVRNRLAQDARFVFPSRIVTREPSSAERHETVSPQEFEALVRRGELALYWNAHGLRYGLSATMNAAVQRGWTVIFNASRRVVSAANARYACAVVYIDAPIHLRAQRLAARSREHAEGIAARLERSAAGFDPGTADLIIDNSRSLAEASECLACWLLGLPSPRTARSAD